MNILKRKKIKKMKVSLITIATLALIGCHYDQARNVVNQNNNAAIDRTNAECKLDLISNERTLIHDEVSSEEYHNYWLAVECQNVNDQSCQNRFVRMEIDQWRYRYALADFGEVASFVSLNPNLIQSDRQYEMLLLHSHNQNVEKMCEWKRAEIRKKTHEKLNRINNQQASALGM
jgi:hypothetical protein